MLQLERLPLLERRAQLEQQVLLAPLRQQVKRPWAQRKRALRLGAARAWLLLWVKLLAVRAVSKVQRQV